ncbi:hypothetical protein [Streptomyces sp. NBC_01451]|uniref:hypothetical protein n=1 Tax=Streptomyces sp. NBC_01451 TaxID=2903872 RepID=UPI002E337297|nr:hypothetical protein [Streptomyces sp. NBC_01451]
MQNVPVRGTTARYPVSLARQLLADMDAVGNDDFTERDLCRLIGRCEVVIASLIVAVEDGASDDRT